MSLAGHAGEGRRGFQRKVNEVTEANGFVSEVLVEDTAQEQPAETMEMELQEAETETSGVPEECRAGAEVLAAGDTVLADVENPVLCDESGEAEQMAEQVPVRSRDADVFYGGTPQGNHDAVARWSPGVPSNAPQSGPAFSPNQADLVIILLLLFLFMYLRNQD